MGAFIWEQQNITHVDELNMYLYMCVCVSAYLCIYILRDLSPVAVDNKPLSSEGMRWQGYLS